MKIEKSFRDWVADQFRSKTPREYEHPLEIAIKERDWSWAVVISFGLFYILSYAFLVLSDMMSKVSLAIILTPSYILWFAFLSYCILKVDYYREHYCKFQEEYEKEKET